LVEFLKRAPLDESVHEVLNSINLSGKVNGDIRLVVLLDERESILDKLLRYVRFKATTTVNQFHPKDTLVVISLVVRIDTNVK
jgi:hypothetical protein